MLPPSTTAWLSIRPDIAIRRTGQAVHTVHSAAAPALLRSSARPTAAGGLRLSASGRPVGAVVVAAGPCSIRGAHVSLCDHPVPRQHASRGLLQPWPSNPPRTRGFGLARLHSRRLGTNWAIMRQINYHSVV